MAEKKYRLRWGSHTKTERVDGRIRRVRYGKGDIVSLSDVTANNISDKLERVEDQSKPQSEGQLVRGPQQQQQAQDEKQGDVDTKTTTSTSSSGKTQTGKG
jgi:low affinity Fe/Cu permease